MPTYRCDWCGRFYSSPLPEPSSCRDHIPEWNAKLTRMIADFKSTIVTSSPARRGAIDHAESVVVRCDSSSD